MRRVSRRARRGFTLIEALLALVLATMLFGAISLYTGTWLRSWSQIVERGGREDTVAIVLDRMVEDLEAAQPIFSNGTLNGRVAFSGDADSVAFVRPALGYGPRPGLDDVTYHNGTSGRQMAVVRSRRGYPASVGGGEDLPLMVGDARLSLAYATSTGEFIAKWSYTDRLPSAVRVTLTGSKPTAWTQSSIARLRVELPAACGGKDAFAECLEAIDARPR